MRHLIPLAIATPFLGLEPLTGAERGAITDRHGTPLATSSEGSRSYPAGDSAAHLIGFASGERDGTTKGRAGVERLHDAELKAGEAVRLTIDHKLQRLAEKLLDSQRGAIVVLDVHTGEVLAQVSSPPFFPGIFFPRISSDEFEKLRDDPAKPLFDRGAKGGFPPGSTFKTITALAACKAGLGGRRYTSPPSLEIDGLRLHNWSKADQGELDLAGALRLSSNTYFYQLTADLEFEKILDAAKQLGLGSKPGTGLLGEAAGYLPSAEDRAAQIGAHSPRRFDAIFSIGQGMTQVSPLQLASAYATIATRGKRWRPQVVAGVGDEKFAPKLAADLSEAGYLEEHFESVVDGLVKTVHAADGTGRAADPGLKVHIAGKTGTAQYGREKRVAWFAGFAPAEDARYALTVVVEGGDRKVGGAKTAAPLARELFKQVLEKDLRP